MVIVRTVLLPRSVSIPTFPHGCNGKGPFFTEEGMGMRGQCQLGDMMREVHLGAKLMAITVLFNFEDSVGVMQAVSANTHASDCSQ